jgi:creatinine amidohydrolase
VAECAWPAVEQALQRGVPALLPVAAACKAHGRHLPMNTDLLQMEWLTTELMRRAVVAIWPPVTYGYYPAFTDYPGSCSLSRPTFVALVSELLGQLREAGAQRVVVLNAGLSTIAPLAEAVTLAAAPVCLLHLYEGAHFRAAAEALCSQPCGGHADELETSIMLAIAPERVDMAAARAWTPRTLQPGPLRRGDPGHPNYAPDGVYGDPRLATAAKGQRLLAAMLRDVLENGVQVVGK